MTPPKWGCGRFPCVLCGVPEPPAPAVNRIAHRPAFLLEVLDPVGAVPPEPSVEHLDELVLGDAAPVAAVEELVLQVAEEALAGRVVGRAPLPRHRAGDAVRRADPLPARPAVMAAAVGVAEGVLPGPQLRARGQQRGVRELGVRAPRYRPAHRLAVEQVDDRREVDLGRVGELELGYVGRPLLVGRVGAEVVGAVVVEGDVLGALVGLAGVGAVLLGPCLAAPGRAVLAHDGAHDLLRHHDGLLPHAQSVRHDAVAADAVLGPELLGHQRVQPCVLVAADDGGALVLIGALRYPQGIGELS